MQNDDTEQILETFEMVQNMPFSDVIVNSQNIDNKNVSHATLNTITHNDLIAMQRKAYEMSMSTLETVTALVKKIKNGIDKSANGTYIRNEAARGSVNYASYANDLQSIHPYYETSAKILGLITAGATTAIQNNINNNPNPNNVEIQIIGVKTDATITN